MKKNSGITMVSLVVAIVILMLLSSIVIEVSMETYDTVKVENFMAQMKVIQTKVDKLAQETEDVSTYGFTALSAAKEEDYNWFSDVLSHPENYQINIRKSWNLELDTKSENYYYFTPQDLQEKLGLKDQELTVIINFKTRNVIARRGVKKEGEYYYRQYDLIGGESLIN